MLFGYWNHSISLSSRDSRLSCDCVSLSLPPTGPAPMPVHLAWRPDPTSSRHRLATGTAPARRKCGSRRRRADRRTRRRERRPGRNRRLAHLFPFPDGQPTRIVASPTLLNSFGFAPPTVATCLSWKHVIVWSRNERSPWACSRGSCRHVLEAHALVAEGCVGGGKLHGLIVNAHDGARVWVAAPQIIRAPTPTPVGAPARARIRSLHPPELYAAVAAHTTIIVHCPRRHARLRAMRCTSSGACASPCQRTRSRKAH